MGRKKSPGLKNRDGVWHIDKQILGVKIRESCHTRNLEEAEQFLAKRINEVRGVVMYGERQSRSFIEAATRYLEENMDNRSITDDASRLKSVMPFLREKPIHQIFDETLAPFRTACKAKGLKNKTINNGVEIVQRVLNCATHWRDESGLTWISSAPKLTKLELTDARKAYPIDWTEQRALLQELPQHAAKMALFKVNTGTREQEVVNLRWEWEYVVPELDASVFIVPGHYVKNGEDRLVVLNRVARAVVDSERGVHPEFVFTYNGRPVSNLRSSAWEKARMRVAFKFAKEQSEQFDVVRRETHYSKSVEMVGKRARRPQVSSVVSLEDLNAARKKEGLKPLRPTSKDVWFQLTVEAGRKFFATHWPEFEGLFSLRVHDLKHTFGRRLRAAGVSQETRKVLLGHTNGDITTHYSAPEIAELIRAANTVCEDSKRKPLTLVRASAAQNSHSSFSEVSGKSAKCLI